MITDDQVVELFAEANPIPELEVLDANSVARSGAEVSTSERSTGMVKVKPEQLHHRRRRRPLLVGALAATLTAVLALPLLMMGPEQTEVATPQVSAEQQALQTAETFFEALSTGDVDAAMALMTSEMRDLKFNKPAVEFLAALPGTKTLSDCTASEGPTTVGVSCTTNYNGPLMVATGETSVGLFTVKDGLLAAFTPGSRDAAAAAFAEYARQTRPETYARACSPESYEVASVRIYRGLAKEAVFAFAGPCGELWAQVAEAVATWVDAGKPPLTEDS